MFKLDSCTNGNISETEFERFQIGTRSNRTGQESNDEIGIRKPAEYPLHSISECITAAKALNPAETEITHEGFVVVDANWHRINVKSPEYVYAHHVATQQVFTKKRILPMVRNKSGCTGRIDQADAGFGGVCPLLSVAVCRAEEETQNCHIEIQSNV